MRMKIEILLLTLLFIGHLSFGFTSDTLTKGDQHTLVAMRLIGHRILHAVGDSTSLVRPVVKNGDQYKVTFDTEFSFLPDSVRPIIDKVISENGISRNYVVEFVTCDSNLIVHSYMVGETVDLPACQGRPLGSECYELFITLVDDEYGESAMLEPMTIVHEKEGISDKWLVLFILLFVSMIGVIMFLISQKSGKNADPNVIKIGEFLFNKRNMELSIHNSKIELTSKEADLLQLLSESANDTVERDDILRQVWGDEGDYVGRTLDVFISKLRKKLEADSNVKIINIRGIGYRLVLNGQDD